MGREGDGERGGWGERGMGREVEGEGGGGREVEGGRGRGREGEGEIGAGGKLGRGRGERGRGGEEGGGGEEEGEGERRRERERGGGRGGEEEGEGERRREREREAGEIENSKALQCVENAGLIKIALTPGKINIILVQALRKMSCFYTQASTLLGDRGCRVDDNTGPIKLTSLLWTLSSKSRQPVCGAPPQRWEQYCIHGRMVAL